MPAVELLELARYLTLSKCGAFSAIQRFKARIATGETVCGGQAMVAINRSGRIGIAIAAALFAAFFSQPLLLLVAGGAVYRAFEKGLTADMRTTAG